jgi:hypothetical protein
LKSSDTNSSDPKSSDDLYLTPQPIQGQIIIQNELKDENEAKLPLQCKKSSRSAWKRPRQKDGTATKTDKRLFWRPFFE